MAAKQGVPNCPGRNVPCLDGKFGNGWSLEVATHKRNAKWLHHPVNVGLLSPELLGASKETRCFHPSQIASQIGWWYPIDSTYIIRWKEQTKATGIVDLSLCAALLWGDIAVINGFDDPLMKCVYYMSYHFTVGSSRSVVSAAFACQFLLLNIPDAWLI